jgi:bifunctional DNA-binding transcriptional regulator/antitoxin component of YhaV-PrlF toxin-antitoxin module
MKLQKQLSRQYKGVNYPKYIVAIPPKQVEQVGWEEGTELEAEVKDNEIVLKPKKRGVL